MAYDFLTDYYGTLCMEEANKGKGRLSFGAVLIKDGKIIGRGRNRLTNSEERRLLSHVDYAIHAEQAAIVQALNSGIDPTDSELYVLGKILTGKNKGTLTTRNKKEFGCTKCPPTFIRFNITVNIPHIELGWLALTPEEAMLTGKNFVGKGTWSKFVRGEITI